MASDRMPEQVRFLCWEYDGWVVGGAASGGEPPRDWDVIVPPAHWIPVAHYLKTWHPQMNSFGGWKLNLGDVSLDVWPTSLDGYILRTRRTDPLVVWHPKSGVRLKTEE